MNTTATHHWLASALFQASNALHQFKQRFRAAKKDFDEKWEARARQAIAMRQLRSLSDRELHDIGIDRADIPRVAREVNFVR